MFDYYKNNSNYLLNLKAKKYNGIYLVFYFILLILFIFSIFYKVSDRINSKIQVSCQNNLCTYYFSSKVNDIKTIKNSKLIYINNHPYSYKIKAIKGNKDSVNKKIKSILTSESYFTKRFVNSFPKFKIMNKIKIERKNKNDE